MRYEEFYNEQLLKFKRRRAFLTKKLPFIIIGALILLSIIVTLFFTSGIPYEFELDNIVYGDVIDNTPKSFLASAKYEYLVDGDYVDTMPDMPGKYYYRVATRNVFGVVKYSSDYEFEIEKASAIIEITDTKVDYGKLPQNIKSNLPRDKKITSFDVIMEDNHKLTTYAWVSNVVIVDESGKDITKYYDLEFSKTEITIEKAPIVITLPDKEKEYDGIPLRHNDEDTSDFLVSGLLNGDEIVKIKTKGSQTLVGESEYNIESVTVEDSNGNSYETYEYVYESAKLKVTPKNIKFTTENVSKEYNGENQEFSDYKIDKEIPDDVIVSPINVNLAGKYEYKLEPKLNDKDGNDVTGCYNILYSFGTITITKAYVKVKLNDLNVTYNGNTVFTDEYTVLEGDLFNSNIELNVQSSIRSSGEGTISYYSGNVIKNNKNVSDSFNIEYVDGTIKINKKELVINLKNASKEYDGNTYETFEFEQEGVQYGDRISVKSKSEGIEIGDSIISVDEISITHDDEDVLSCYDITTNNATLTITKRNVNVTISNAEIIYGSSPSFSYEVEGLLENDVFDMTDYIYSSNIGDNEVDIESYSISNGIINRDDYYEVTIKKGNLKVLKKSLELSMYKKSKIYDGTSLTVNASDYYISKGALLASDSITFIASDYSILDVGSQVVPFNQSNVLITNSSDEDVTNCYDIKYNDGNLAISPKTLIITTGSITKPYDFTVLTWEEYSQSGLIIGDRIEIEITGKLYYIGETSNTVGNVTIYDSNDRDVTSNYVFTIYEGTLMFTERSA